MEFLEVIRRRRMVREFTDQSLTSEQIDRILASGLRAPSAKSTQGWALLVLTDPADRARFYKFVPNQANHTPGIMNAPLVIVPLAHKTAYLANYAMPDGGFERTEDQWPAPYWYIDTGMATMLMLLTAVDEGLGGFFFWIMPAAAGGFDGEKIPAHVEAFKSEFGIPSDYSPVGAIVIGHRPSDLPSPNPSKASDRPSVSQVVHNGQFGNK
jgi:nitroreductase